MVRKPQIIHSSIISSVSVLFLLYCVCWGHIMLCHISSLCPKFYVFMFIHEENRTFWDEICLFDFIPSILLSQVRFPVAEVFSVVNGFHFTPDMTEMLLERMQNSRSSIHPNILSSLVWKTMLFLPWLLKNTELPESVTVIILNIGTDKSEQTVQTQIRLLLMEQSDQDLLCLLFCLHLLNTILHCKTQLFQL